MKVRTVLLAVCVSAIATSTAMAHPDDRHLGSSGLLAGFAHPWLGFDHLLAMIAVGLLSVQMSGRALWVLPTSFIGSMILGAATGMSGLNIWFLESGIAVSVIALGAALLVGRNYPLAVAAGVIGAFGVLHGHAHGTEIPAMAAPFAYATGFVSATALLHLAGIGGGLCAVRTKRWTPALRYSGAAIFCAGLLFLFAAI